MTIKGCVFDFGGVMTTSTTPLRLKKACASFGIDWSVLENGFAKYRNLMDGDFMTMERMYSKIWEDAGMDTPPETTAALIEEDRRSWLYRNERTLEWMRSLKSRGFAIGILTNMCTSFAPLFREHFSDFIALSGATVVSGEVRMFKPMREIYDLASGRIGLEPRELCFFDDLERNCEGARKAGWSAVRFSSNAEAEEGFEALLAKAGEMEGR